MIVCNQARSQITKDPDSDASPKNGPCPHREINKEGQVMDEKSCAACDCKLDATAITVTIGGHVVEVCCEECAQTLRDAKASALRTEH